jgi:hypothetical protein
MDPVPFHAGEDRDGETCGQANGAVGRPVPNRGWTLPYFAIFKVWPAAAASMAVRMTSSDR